jgi:hypothetical protein
MLKLGFATSTNKNPSRHLPPREGDSQKAGEHRAENTTVPGPEWKRNQVRDVGTRLRLFGLGLAVEALLLGFQKLVYLSD